MYVAIASAAMSDDAFLAAFNNCTLPGSWFRHGDHLRLAWIQLHRHPFGDALAAVREGIRNYATHNGMPNLFHETITTAWVKLLATHHEPTFGQFISENEHRLNLELLHRFWTPELLASDAARSSWLPPDRAPLPAA
jgi:CDP-diacylglycerol--glycerol-3-phosphate 3-phosphatidyltransferase